ncbi:hypothetical protein AB0K51_19645 [Kitasatospora sp. NPDC049285]|uniref:hypothetical protein n=1 Tax=Kitasatospora sp. NPDC049285 TaxID=3157096 RepID=UPI003424CB8F
MAATPTGLRPAELAPHGDELTDSHVIGSTGRAGTGSGRVRVDGSGPAGGGSAWRPDASGRDASGTGPANRSTGLPAGPAERDDLAIDCLVTRHPHLPRDRMGHRLNDAGRWLVTEALAGLYGVRLSPRQLARDEHRRWSVPELGLNASVAHCAEYSTVALAPGQRVGVDLQDHRDRPLAMQWLGALLGRPAGEAATLRDFAECEALIKASHLRKETFAGVRLPDWRPGWRPTNVGYLVRSADLGHGLHLALATDAPTPVRWWWQPGPAEPAVRTAALTLEPAA